MRDTTILPIYVDTDQVVVNKKNLQIYLVARERGIKIWNGFLFHKTHCRRKL